MTTQVAKQAEARARRPAVPAGVPILAAKITAPDVPDWAIPRPRITKLIAQGRLRCPLTVLTAPAGAGKTMALALWAAAEPGTVAWVGLDEFDSRPGSSGPMSSRHCDGLALPCPRRCPPLRGRDAGHVFVLRLAAALAAQNQPVTLVLDDLHLLTDPQVLDELDYLLRNAGPGLRLVVSARMDPRAAAPLPAGRAANRDPGQRPSIHRPRSRPAPGQARRHAAGDSLECLTRRTEGWAAGLRLAAISMGAHPDPDQFVKELITDNSALTGYLVEEVLNTQPPGIRDVLLSTSILEQVSAEAASELTGNDQAAAILPALARVNGFIQPIGSGWYRYHTLFAEVLRLKLSREHPDRMAALHRRAARWYERNGQLTDAVRHAAATGDWQLAASIVIDGLAIGQIIEPRGSPSLADAFGGMPHGQAWTGPQPYLVSAAVVLSAAGPEAAAAALDAAESILERLPADQAATGRLAAAMIRLAASRRSGDLMAAAAAAARAEELASRIPAGKLARHPDVRARVLSGRGAVELWSGHLDEAARVLQSAVAAETASGGEGEPADCLGHLALAEALRGRLRQAATLAAQATAAPTAGAARPAGTRTPRHLSRWPGCTWNTMNCVRRAAGSSRQTPPSA